MLIEQVEQAQKLQTDAEKEADAAMTQLEEFINEQEKLVGIAFLFLELETSSCQSISHQTNLMPGQTTCIENW